MPQCLVRGVRSVELTATNFEEAGRFYETVWGLQAVSARNDALLYRGTAAYHHIVGLHRGPKPALLRIVFDVADRAAVHTLHKAVSAAGCPVSAPTALASDGGGYGFGCKDPDGRNLAFLCECADHADTQSRPDRPRQIAHVNLNALDFDASYRFFTDTLGLRLIDENAPLWFLHCATTEHSSIVLAETKLPTLNHIAFEMPDFDSVMRGMGRMKDNGYPIEWGPGRHGPATTYSPISAGPTNSRSSTRRRCCRSTTATCRAARTIGNSRPGGPTFGVSRSRARPATIVCKGCSDSPRMGIALGATTRAKLVGQDTKKIVRNYPCVARS